MSEAIATIVSAYSGDPDTRDSRRIQEIGNIDHLPIGTVLYAQNSQDGTVVITQAELDRLQERDDWLNALEAAGVDNWQGWDEAKDIQAEWDEENAN